MSQICCAPVGKAALPANVKALHCVVFAHTSCASLRVSVMGFFQSCASAEMRPATNLKLLLLSLRAGACAGVDMVCH